MWKRDDGGLATALSIALVASALLSGVPVDEATAVSDNEAPLADAGLDRNVTANVTVYLDATGSRDPDGEVDRFEWRLERPDGNYTAPRCRDCGRTSFVPRQPGTYNATVTVTDDNGATSRDTLRVRVAQADGPSVSIDGPDEVVVGDIAAFSASVSAGTANLAAVTWRLDGQRLNRTNVRGQSAVVDLANVFTSNGTYTLHVTATDQLGREGTASKNVTVRDRSDGGGSVTGGLGGDSDGEACSRFNRDDDTYCDNDRLTADTEGITISDADNDGTTEWAGVTLNEEFAQRHDGVSYDSTDGQVVFDSQEAYRDALDVDYLSIDPTSDINENQDEQHGSNSAINSDNGRSPFPVSPSDTIEQDSDNTGISATSDGSIDDLFSDITNLGSNNEDTDEERDDQTNEENDDNSSRTGRAPPDRGSLGGF